MNELERKRAKLLAGLARRIRSPETLRAMAAVPRERFVPFDSRGMAYLDIPLAIGEGQTISQPTMVAEMTSALRLSTRDKVLEVGTGSGYQAAVLAQLAPDGMVVTVERLPALAAQAEAILLELDYRNIVVELAGPVPGCPERGPYDAILVAAAAPAIPLSLLPQLRVGGRMALPIGSREQQELMLVLKTGEGISINVLGPCRFVPLLGAEGFPE
jgi:protein-L-isoaspartate(D-aspartate) O-methyltransferase